MLKEIEALLGQANMMKIRSSCFGKLFHMCGELFDPHVYRQLIRSMERGSEGRGSMSFRVSSRSIEFGLEDFALVSGLPCHNADCPVPSTSKFHNSVFKGQSFLALTDVGRKFREECSKDRESPTCLRLALLLIVHGLMLIRDPITSSVDLRYLHLIDDLNAFLSYPWARAAYEFLVHETHDCRRKLEAHEVFVNEDSVSEVRINAPGFTAALICWSYEVFPMVGVKCGNHERLDIVPRMLRWKSMNSIQFEEVEYLFSDGGAYPVPMTMSDEEKLMMRSLKKQSHLPSFYDRSKIRGRRLDFDEAVAPHAWKKNRSAESPAVSKSNPLSYDNEAEAGNNDLQIVVEELVNGMKERDLKQSNMLERLERVERFMESAGEIPLPTALKDKADAYWFDAILSRLGLLSSDHIDALTNLLIIEQKKDPKKFLNGWSIMEEICWVALTQDVFEAVADRVLPYVRGHHPIEGALAWHLADRIFGVEHVCGCHWVLYEVELDKQQIMVYNSLSKKQEWKYIASHFKNVARAIPILCKMAGVWERKNMQTPLRDRFTVVGYKHAPQQTNSCDCGILVIKFMECLAAGHPLDYIHPERCGIYCRSYCAKLYEYGRTKMVRTPSPHKV